MKKIYFVTEGITDQIVIAGLVRFWLGEEIEAIQLQPPQTQNLFVSTPQLSQGWKGVHTWCKDNKLQSIRDDVLERADCLIIHIDADVAFDGDFKSPILQQLCPPASNACNWVRDELISCFEGGLPNNVVLCVLAQDLETWILTALHPETANEYAPIECRQEPGALLMQRREHKLIRRKDGKLKKNSQEYVRVLPSIIKNWQYCTSGDSSHCLEALRFESEAKQVFRAL